LGEGTFTLFKKNLVGNLASKFVEWFCIFYKLCSSLCYSIK
jgi:hypothetical protein